MSEQIEIKPEVKLSDALGKYVICEDGIKRKVTNITFSMRYRDKCIVNEGSRESDHGTGFFIHTLSLVWQLQGKGVPSIEEMQAASKVWASMYYEEGDGPLSRIKMWRRNKKGILLPFN